MIWINIFNYKEKYGYYKKSSLLIAIFLLLFFLYSLIMKFDLIPFNNYIINYLFYFSIFSDFLLVTQYCFNIFLEFVSGLPLYTEYWLNLWMNFINFFKSFINVFKSFYGYLKSIFFLNNIVYMGMGEEELGNENNKKGLDYVQTGNDSDTASNNPNDPSKTYHGTSNEVSKDDNQRVVSSEVGENANYEVFNENINEMDNQNNWYSGYKWINGQLYHNILADRLVSVPVHVRMQHPEIMQLIDFYNQRYDWNIENGLPPLEVYQNLVYNLELIWKLVNEDSVVLKSLLIEGCSYHGLREGFLNTGNWVDNPHIQADEVWRTGTFYKYNSNTGSYDKKLFRFDWGLNGLGKKWWALDTFISKIEKGEYLYAYSERTLNKLTKLTHESAMDILRSNDRYSYSVLSPIHRQFPTHNNLFVDAVKIDALIQSQLEDIRRETLLIMDNKIKHLPNRAIMKFEFNLAMDKYKNIIRLKVYCLQREVYISGELVPNPWIYRYIDSSVRQGLLVSNSPENSRVLALIKKYNPDSFTNEIAQTGAWAKERETLEKGWNKKPLNPESPQGSRIQAWAKEQNPVWREKPLTIEYDNKEVTLKRKRSFTESNNEQIIAKRKKS